MGLKKNTIINMMGSLAPIIITLFTVPAYLNLIGEIRYGVLAIVWLFLGYFGLFDMGLGRAITNQIAKLKLNPAKDREGAFWVALSINAGFGLLGGAILWATGIYFFQDLFKMPMEIRAEALSALPWLAAAVPVATITSVMIGALTGREKFLLLNVVQFVDVLLFQLLPLSIAFLYGPNLSRLIPAAVIARIIGGIPLFIACKLAIPLKGDAGFDIQWIKPLLRFGGWVTISGIVSPILTSIDRFLIGAIVGAQAVTIYTVPYNLTMKIMILPWSLGKVIFPRFSMQNKDDANSLAHEGIISLGVLMTLVIIIVLLLLRPFLAIWIGPELAQQSAPIGGILLLGVWMNGLAAIPYALLQGQGHPETTAKIHLIELVPFVLILWYFLKMWGLEGAAVAWCLRVTFDAGFLFWASSIPRRHMQPLIPAIGFLSIGLGIFFTFAKQLPWLVGSEALLLIFAMSWGWHVGPPGLLDFRKPFRLLKMRLKTS